MQPQCRRLLDRCSCREPGFATSSACRNRGKTWNTFTSKEERRKPPWVAQSNSQWKAEEGFSKAQLEKATRPRVATARRRRQSARALPDASLSWGGGKIRYCWAGCILSEPGATARSYLAGSRSCLAQFA